MKKFVTACTAVTLVAGLTAGCSPGQNTTGSTVVGTVGGGLLGAALFHGSGAWIGVLGSALVGGVIGNFVGKKMDENDRARMAQAVTTTPMGQEASWTNSHNVTYRVRPVQQYHRNNQYCREYQTTVVVGGETKRAYGTACRAPDGQWKIVS